MKEKLTTSSKYFGLQQNLIHNGYDITEAPWWKAEHTEPRGVNVIKTRIFQLKQALNDEVSHYSHYSEGYTVFHQENYVLQCITGECNVKLTYKDVESFLRFDYWKMMYLQATNQKLYRTVVKIKNVHRALQKLFPSSFSSGNFSPDNLHVEFIQELHREIGKDIISKAGKFREKSAAPAGEDVFRYMEPEFIEANLKQLLSECRSVFSQPEIDFLDAVKYAACFMHRFLFIHPFSNGNGRIARLLLSLLLQPFTIVPLSLYTESIRREAYFSCLREAQQLYNNPSPLARFILESLEREFELCCFMMAVDV